jgi:beta-xylosidase
MVLSSLSVTVGLLTLAAAAPAGKINKRSFSNGPLLQENFPDPAFIKVGDTYHAFATNSNGKKAPHATSNDFNTWTLTGDDALPNVGAWSTGANVWASDVIQLVRPCHPAP